MITGSSISLHDAVKRIVNHATLPDASGGTSEVYFVKPETTRNKTTPQQAILKKPNVKCATEYIKSFNEKKSRCDNLANQGVNVAQPLECLYVSQKQAFYESQQYAKGDVIGISSPATASSKYLAQEYKVATYDDLENFTLSQQEANKMANGVVTYNLGMLNTLIHASDEHLIKFLSDYKTIVKSDVSIDNTPENFVYDSEKGITFIDLGEYSYPVDVQTVTDDKIFNEIVDIFKIPNSLGQFLNDTQKDMLLQTQSEFVSKAQELAPQAGYELTQTFVCPQPDSEYVQ